MAFQHWQHAQQQDLFDWHAEIMAARKAKGALARNSGLRAEDHILQHYEKAGARLIAKNWRADRRHGNGELDLVFEQDGQTIFVEVKKRRTIALALQAVAPQQWQRIYAAVDMFMAQHDRFGSEMRVDVAACDRFNNFQIVENATQLM